MRFKLTIAYDGTNYAGWQVQPNAQSIQTLVQRAIETLLRHPISLTGAGRTDAGVHALGQTAHFDTGQPIDCGRLRYSANALLPPDIRLLSAEEAAADFHARYSATSKVYHYHLRLDAAPDPMTRLYRTPVHGPFDLHSLERAARRLIGEHDFACFANQSERGVAARDSVRILQRVDIVEEAGGIRLEFEGDGFLYKMVRNMTGALLEVAAGKRPPENIDFLFEKKNRRLSGPTAPALGLFLMRVNYTQTT